MKILLVHPTFDTKDKKIWLTPEQLPPPFLGVNLLATILENEGYDVEVLDELFKYYLDIKDGYKTWWERIKEIIEKKDIDILGITVLTHFRTLCFRIAQLVKKLKPDIKIIFGGPHASFTPRQIFEAFPNTIDAIVVKQGEYAIRQIAIKVKEKKNDFYTIENVATPERPDIPNLETMKPINTDVDENPAIDYKRYLKLIPGGIKKAMVITSRGCPHQKCIFCSAPSLTPGYSTRLIDKVYEDISSLKKYGVCDVEFHDEVFLLDHQRLKDIFSDLKNKKIVFDNFYCHCRPVDLTDINVKTIKNTIPNPIKNWKIFIGLESGSEKLRKTLCKFKSSPVTNNTIIRNFLNAKEILGDQIGVFLIFGTEGETVDTIKETYDLLKVIEPFDAFCSILRVYPGTKLCKTAIEKRIFKKNYWIKKPDNPFFFYPQGKDYYLARAAVELFTQRFSSEKIRAKAEQSLDPYLYSDNEADREQINKEKKVLEKNLK